MIKFFRNIRRRLLRENRFTRYLIYAIGEIVLVVIGILIALQINNWNEEKKLFQKEERFLKEIKLNLIQDTIQISNVLESNRAKIKNIMNIMQKMDTKYSVTERRMALDIPKIAEFALFSQNNTAYSNLLDSESIDLIRDKKLRELLSDYYNTNWEYKGNANITQRTREITKYISEHLVTKEAIKNAFNIETNLPSAKEYQFNADPYFISNFLSISAMTNHSNVALIDFRTQNQKLREKIDNYLVNQDF
ncbi:MAG TPA: DUF6090 family protein [Christiangramia sp.]|nr:DUF6090 family protein [Christiangramia sp.]